MNSIEELQNNIYESRRRIGFHYTALSEEVNITLRLRNSIRRQPWSWMGSALATGIIASFFRRSSKAEKIKLPSSKKRSSFMQHAGAIPSLLLGETTLALATGKFLRLLFPLLRPIITEYVTRKFHSSEKEHQAIDFRP
ncbi:MAG: hypothetical protein K2W97_04760 [Chthoniobacterales bacterium]|nr:hypothetical protein [Chthoniobacterales bacterium]